MKVSAVVAFASLMAATLNGANVWVDGRMPDYSGHDGSTEALAFETIQEAVAAASAGDTVKVKPGVYDSGATALPSDDGGNLVRVLVDKKLRIESTDGAAVTHIVGAADTDGKETDANARKYGLGDKAVRCVSVLDAGAGTIIKGFTIRGGRSRYDGNANQASTHAGGIKGAGQDTYVVDCVVSNCVATRGGSARDITAIRTLFQDNIAINNGGSATRFSRHYACLFVNNGLEYSAVALSAIADSGLC